MILQKWDCGTRRYYPYEVPDDWDPRCGGSSMAEIISCASCGKRLPYGETYTSLEIHTKLGFGYGVCQGCFDKELARKMGEKK